MNIAIIPNVGKPDAIEYAKKIIRFLRDLGAEIILTSDLKSIIEDNFAEYVEDARCAAKKSDVVIALGGDGTIIRNAKYCALEKKPILGINFGRLGFVAGLEPEETDSLSRLISGDFETEKRMVLEIRVYKNGNESVSYAINDAVISRGYCSRMIDLRVDFNGKKFNTFRADGVIFSTPTGSTAYNLSAGGPVIDPGMECVCLVPICPHSLFSRPVIFKGDSVLSVSGEKDENNDIYLTLDGHETVQINEGDRVEIRKAEIYAELIKLKNKDFYAILNEKLSERGSENI